MTLKEFLTDCGYTINLDNLDSEITAKIRMRVQNIDVLANRDIITIKEQDIVDIFMAVLLYKHRGGGVPRNLAWAEFENEATKMGVPKETINIIAQNL